MRYDPDQSVQAFIAKHGERGRVVLDSWNQIDPFHILLEEFDPQGEIKIINSDEYLGYAQRFMEKMKSLTSDRKPTEEEVEELVRQSFHKEQVERGWVTPDQIKHIALGICLGCFKM